MTRPSVTPPPASPRELTDRTAPDFIEENRVAVIAFVSPDDEACQKLRARLALVASRMVKPDVAFGVLDVTRDPHVAEAMGVHAVPMLFVFRDGESVDRVMGAPPERVLEDVILARL